jgi:hypothetical protein
VLRRGSERAENVIKLIAIELKFSLDIWQRMEKFQSVRTEGLPIKPLIFLTTFEETR